MQQLLEYLGEASEPCNNCSSCLDKKELLHSVLTPIDSLLFSKLAAFRASEKQKLFGIHHYFLALLKPTNEHALTTIPGVGTGWKKLWQEKWYNATL